MDAQYLDGMARTVAEVMGMGSVDRNRVRDALESYWFDKAVDVWTVEDIINICHENGLELEVKQARLVAQRAEARCELDESLSYHHILAISRKELAYAGTLMKGYLDLPDGTPVEESK